MSTSVPYHRQTKLVTLRNNFLQSNEKKPQNYLKRWRLRFNVGVYDNNGYVIKSLYFKLL